MEKSSPRMTGGTREAPVNSSPAVASNAEGEEIEVLESTDVLPVAQEDQWKSLFDKILSMYHGLYNIIMLSHWLYN
ncbi:Phage-like element PBSX protein XkdK [Dissostichus eleginoides]|uniref:Phage-like element PBSX protein XkdK n=1 Tax=Dissostichus eleginoides TaxID=100907 RepID=A0AAD9F231_DISEL|nr:Phage-like element PBSX protein XkdK [Dissostichus eleginoides]